MVLYSGESKWGPPRMPLPPPRNKALIRPYFGKRMVKSPLIKPAISWGKCGIGGVPLALGSHDASQVDSWTVSAKANTPEV